MKKVKIVKNLNNTYSAKVFVFPSKMYKLLFDEAGKMQKWNSQEELKTDLQKEYGECKFY